MDRAPSEIWTEIFSQACVDSGLTGRSLSLVSKFIRAESAPMKLQSISVHGFQQIIAFHRLLLQTPSHHRHIRYLLLSTTPPAPSNRQPWMPSEEMAQLRIAYPGILTTIARHVEILYLDVPADHLWDAPTMSFPNLAELTSNGFPMVPSTIAKKLIAYPQLRRWHLTEYHVRLRSPRIFTDIRITAPAMTHLRFSGIQQELSFPFDLPYELPASIQHVYVKPAGPPSIQSGTSSLSYAGYMSVLEKFSMTERRLVLLPGYVLPPGHNTKETVKISTLSDWEARIAGGDGCWSLRKRVVPSGLRKTAT